MVEIKLEACTSNHDTNTTVEGPLGWPQTCGESFQLLQFACIGIRYFLTLRL